MAYLDTNGNVNWTDPTQGQVGQQWQHFIRQQSALLTGPSRVAPVAPATATPAGSEKAERGHD